MASAFVNTALQGRVALISGGGSGIGFGIATRLGEHGACVVLMGRRIEFLENAKKALTKKGIRCEIVQGDVRSEESAKAAVKKAVEVFG